MKFVLAAFLTWRLLLFVPLFFAQSIPYAPNADYTNLWKFTKPYFPVNHFLLYPWANFDGVHYLSIAGTGYAQDGTNARFLPLYPITIFTVTSIFRGETYQAIQFFTAFFLANAFFLMSLFVLYRLILFDYSQNIAKKTIIFLLLFPVSFFFGSIYSESLFLLLSLLSFYFMRQRQWLFAGVAGFFLSATRIVGISILPALLYEAYRQKKESAEQKTKSIKSLLIKYSPFTLLPLGILLYAWFNAISWHDPLHFLKAHSEIGTGRSADAIIFFPQTIFRYLKILLSTPSSQFTWWIALFELAIFFFTTILLYIGCKKGVRLSYLLFAALCFLIPTLSGTFTGLPRYTIILFPIFLSLALLKNRYVQIAYAIASGALLFTLLAFFSRGYYVA
ncbi:MAG: hypothetical protein HY431_02310 [Candidatus Levybacteria bacterium]|nr:hypothetical protein [Candidatus Levybacteria bacterium]